MILTQEQLKAKNDLLAFLNTHKTGQIILSGQAGTGKSTIIKEVVGEFNKQQAFLKTIDNENILKIIYTATTHKARRVLQKVTKEPVRTIHNLIGVTPYSKECTKYVANSLVIIDECSYIDKKLYEFINTALKDCLIIFMGDEAQLPPVNSTNSYVFTLGLTQVDLTQPIRQESKEIADLSCALRQYILKQSNEFPKIQTSKSLIRLSRKAFRKQLLGLQDFKNNQIICYTNTKSSYYNQLLFKRDKGRIHYEVGDELICNSFYEGIYADTPVVIEYLNERYVQVKCAESGKKAVSDNLERKHIDLRPQYSITTHKAQGSTFDSVYIDLSDFRYVSHLTQLARLLYVAISRAKYTVYFTGDI